MSAHAYCPARAARGFEHMRVRLTYYGGNTIYV
jgi:hypothetical protein